MGGTICACASGVGEAESEETGGDGEGMGESALVADVPNSAESTGGEAAAGAVDVELAAKLSPAAVVGKYESAPVVGAPA